jgi:4-hydroxy-3-methylbut-2-enyl diphosphate reductase
VVFLFLFLQLFRYFNRDYPMKIIRAKVLGFCMGVRRAVELAKAEAVSALETGSRVFTAGPLIHNPVVLQNLQDCGVEILDDASPEDLHGDVVIIRAHGVGPETEKKLAMRGARIADATCPKVKASQMKARSLSLSGYRIFLAGEKHHGEIAGIQGYIADADAGTDAAAAAGAEAGVDTVAEAAQGTVVADFREAERAAEELFALAPLARTALIAQTTISPSEYRAIGDAIKKYFPGLEIVHTICGATEDRQEALRNLIDDVDVLIVAGGRESSNTRRLLAIAESCGKPAFLAETPADISGAKVLSEIMSYKTIGICAGASTPDDVIDGIETVLKNHACPLKLSRKISNIHVRNILRSIDEGDRT